MIKFELSFINFFIFIPILNLFFCFDEVYSYSVLFFLLYFSFSFSFVFSSVSIIILFSSSSFVDVVALSDIKSILSSSLFRSMFILMSSSIQLFDVNEFFFCFCLFFFFFEPSFTVGNKKKSFSFFFFMGIFFFDFISNFYIAYFLYCI